METPKALRIFFSSPGDVKMERETARNITRRLEMEAGDAITIEPYLWEHEVMTVTMNYQQNIPEMNSFDIVRLYVVEPAWNPASSGTPSTANVFQHGYQVFPRRSAISRPAPNHRRLTP